MDSNVIGLDYKLAKTKSQLIKVIGVGGGGGNAVNYMYQQGITDVSFALCNTDQWALSESPIETKIQLGTGLGAGGRPMVSQEAAENARAEIENILEDTQMVFITASMGGGTGTGAAPIVAQIAKEKKILTVGVVSVPFAWEGKKKFKLAYEGVIELSKNVDALLVIQNSKLKDAYPDLTFKNALGKVNEVLCQAVKGIAEIITVTGYINLDFADVDSTMRNGGFVLMNIGEGEGEDRVGKALKNALDSPLVQDTGYQRAKRMLFNLYCSEDFPQEEIETFVDFMEQMDEDIELIWGVTFDNELGDKVK
ncbi:MAG: cell division protein FtsZ, partial [Paludibacteraceae bacterium]|nr:cell division protein FtsZ [Paludibacteraceae bacterium]